MKWALISRTHINMGNVVAFFWSRGVLYVRFIGNDVSERWTDPDRKLYLKMCRSQGLQPYEEEKA